jgi:hypothetical protein
VVTSGGGGLHLPENGPEWLIPAAATMLIVRVAKRWLDEA